MKIIRIPRTPPSSFDKDRPASDLLKWQVKHALAVEQALAPERRARHAAQPIQTESEAAEYIGAVTKRLHPQAARRRWKLPPGPRAPKSGVWLGPATTAKPKRKTTRKPAPKHRKRAAARKGAKANAKKKRAVSRKPSARGRKTSRRR